ncbi:MAG: glycosyltransferase family 9 protein [Bacteroidia bacterium]|nr:glycosyltransferase family 9 protein [Bacteroidia bacterium]MCO5252805.1 glycosyltransferase family 9 protein [Bacteroidota bacterium]
MKILVVRFSSIGDIVLTSPVLRCIKEQIKGAELHFATKYQYQSIFEFNPYIDKLHLLADDYSSFARQLKKEKFDFVVDLHHNLRTFRLKSILRTKSASFDKLNFQKWLTVRTCNKKHMPKIHIVDRYLNASKSLGIVNDGKGLEYFCGDTKLPPEIEPHLHQLYHAVAIGGTYFTKRMPVDKLTELLKKSTQLLILLGGKEDFERGQDLALKLQGQGVINLCGRLTINQSALVIKNCLKLITHDTGLMHIGAAFDKPIISIWGNTIPEFGMTPYYSDNSKNASQSVILEVENLYCRPCSKLGFDHCPKGHFRCMNDIDFHHVQL